MSTVLLLFFSLVFLAIPWQQSRGQSVSLYQTGPFLAGSFPATFFLACAAWPSLFVPPGLPLLLLVLTTLAALLILLRHGPVHLRLFCAGLVIGPLPFLTHLAVAGPAFQLLIARRYPAAFVLTAALPLLIFHLQGPLFSFFMAARRDPHLAERIHPLFRGLALRPPHVLVSHLAITAPNAWVLGLGFPRPRLVFGPGLREQLTDDELSALSLHEAGHQRNGDNLRAWWTNIALSFISFSLLLGFSWLPSPGSHRSLLVIFLIPWLSAWIVGRWLQSTTPANREVLADQPALDAGLAKPLRRTLRFLWQVPEDVADGDVDLPGECRLRLQAINQVIDRQASAK